MPAVATQQLATIADLDQGPSTSSSVQALTMFDATTKNTFLRRASGKVLAAYAIRFGRTSGQSFALATWGDLTISMTVDIARWMLLSSRGYSVQATGDASFKDAHDEAIKILDEISDITNKTPRRDPDASDGSDTDEELGALASSEGGEFNQSDAWAAKPTGSFEVYP